MRKIALSLAFALALSASLAPARAAGFPAGFPAADAPRLLNAADHALGDLERLSTDPKAGLDPGDSRYAPFRGSLTFLRSVMDELRGTLASGDPEFFGLLDRGSAALGEARVNWARTGGRNEAVAERLRAVSDSYRLLRSTCGREGLRQRQGGTLSEAERRQLQRIQRSEGRFAGKLQHLRDQARRRGDAVTAAEMERFRLEAERIARASADLETYLNTLISASELRGEWSADAPYVRKAAPPEEVAAADEAVEDLYVDSDIGQVFAINLSNLGAGGAAPAPGAVEVYEPSQEVVAAEAVTEPASPAAPGAELDSEGETVEDVAAGEAVEPEGDETVETVEIDAEAVAEPAEPAKPAAGEPSIQPTIPAAPAPEAGPGTAQAVKPATEEKAGPASPPPPATPLLNRPPIG